jgi:hypothetical protein
MELLLEFVRGILIPNAGVNLHVVIPCEVFRSIVVPKACFVLETLATSENWRVRCPSKFRRQSHRGEQCQSQPTSYSSTSFVRLPQCLQFLGILSKFYHVGISSAMGELAQDNNNR